ncbi:uncharacterized protein LOC144172816 isoform X1 [Haemaphysalis longicornis]
MATGGTEYTLVGFSEEVDRRPLLFLEPLPAAKVCSACGLVPNVKASLPCDHIFCKPCYEQCERSGRITCPLDGDQCSDEEVIWMNHPARSILAKQVRCWNHRNGCNVATTAADISRHFHYECGHHSATCPKCSAEILANDVCAHLESRCDASREPSTASVHARTNASEDEENLSATRSDLSNGFQRIHNAVSTAMSSIQAELRKLGRTMEIAVTATAPRHEEADERSFQTRLLQESLSQMSIHEAKLKDQLDEFTQNAYANQQTFYNSFVEKNEAFKQSITDTISSRIDHSGLATQFAAFREAMGDGQRETNAELDRLSHAIDRQNDRMGELLRSTDPSPETRARNSAESAEAHSDSLAQDASKIAWAKSSSAEDRQNALALLPSIIPAATTHTWTLEEYRSRMQRAGSHYLPPIMPKPVYLRGYCVSAGVGFIGNEKVYLQFGLHKGKLDRYLQWPFNFQIRLSILHPEGNQKLEYCMTPSRIPFYMNRFSRPFEASDSFVTVLNPFFNIAELDSWGFTKDGPILLRLSLEDPSAD